MKKAYTLIELLIVISIIALLSLVAFASLSRARLQARDTKRWGDLYQVRTAIETFKSDYGHYPPIEDSTPDGWPKLKAVLSGEDRTLNPRGIVYLRNLPYDPVNQNQFVYTYLYDSRIDKYEIHFYTEYPQPVEHILGPDYQTQRDFFFAQDVSVR